MIEGSQAAASAAMLQELGLPPARLGDRGYFPDLQARAYLNHAAISPPSLAVRRVIDRWLDAYGRRGLDAFFPWHDRRIALRGALAELIGARPDDLVLVANATTGVIDIAMCLPWQRGDRVLCFRGEFPTNVTPWQRAAELHGLELAMLDLAPFMSSPDEGLAVLERELERGARLVAVSAVQFSSGLRMPLGEMAALCHRHGAEIFVDAIQACGAVPIDVSGDEIDYLTCGGHKWLMAVEGTGFLHVAPRCADALRPNIAGWLSHEDAITFLTEGPGHLRYDRGFKAGPARFEVGSCNAVGFAALEASLAAIQSLGVPAIHDHVNGYLDRLEPGLLDRGFRTLRSSHPGSRSAILSVLPPDGIDVIALNHALGARGIACSTPDGALRFAPHWPNHTDEVPDIVAAVDEALAEQRS